MQRCPLSQASRKFLEVVTVSERAVTSLGERSLASDADLTHGGTKPNWPVTSSSASEFETRCLEAGADAFIEKSNSPTQIIAAFRSLLVTEEQAAIEDAATPAGPTKLSKRQKQLILMLDQGLSNRDIAEKLDISEHTVKVHFWRLFRRLGVNSRTQALHFARTNGWLGI